MEDNQEKEENLTNLEKKPIQNLDGSCHRQYFLTKTGKVLVQTSSGLKERKTWIDRVGYESVALPKWVFGTRNKLVHRLVWEAFNGPIPKGMWINHKDGNKANNHLDNLELTTPSENHFHASRVLKRRYARGLETSNALLTPLALEAIVLLKNAGWSQNKIAGAFGVSQVAICNQLKKAN